jgi:hypothetical protein
MNEVHHDVGSSVQQNDVSTYQHVRALRWRRRQAALQVYGNRLKAFLEAWRECTAPHKLFFQSRGQTIFLSESWREIVFVLVIPSAGRFAVAVFVAWAVLIVVCRMFVVTLSVSMPLGHGEIACEHEGPNSKAKHPPCRAHCSLRSEAGLTSD